MELNQYNRRVMTNGGETTKFTAEMNGAAFAIFSDTLYQHKIAAVVREICCNAYDSHIEAGCEETPFYVKLPNRFDPNFVVEDWGIGLDDDGVRKVFASYFKSTKNASKKQTGGFGIGAKSIFSYSNTFEITATKNGVMRKYAAFIGAEGIPEVQIFSETSTDNPNGVCVKIPVQEKDFDRFANEASVILSGFRTTPTVVGRDFSLVAEDIHQEIDQKGFARIPQQTRSTLYSGNAVYALLNNVFYPIPHSVIYQETDATKLSLVMNNQAFVIRFEDGELAPAAPREFLSLDDNTKEKVAIRIHDVVEESLKEFQEEIDSKRHPLDAIDYLYNEVGVNGFKIFTYGTRRLSYYNRRSVKIPHAQYGNVHVTRGGNRVRRQRMVEDVGDFLPYRLNEDKKYYLFYRAVGAKETPMKTHVSKYIKRHNFTDGTRFIIIDGECSELRLERIEKLCGITFEKVDNITLAEQVRKERKEARARKIIGEKTDTTIYAKIIDGNGYERAIRHNDVSNSSITYYYIDIDDTGDYSHIISPDFFEGEVNYILANTMNIRKIKENGLRSVEEVVDEFVEQNPSIKKFLIYSQVFDGMGLGGKSSTHDYFLNASQTPEAVRLKEKHEEYKNLSRDYGVAVTGCKYFRKHIDREAVAKLRTEIDDFCNMFEFVLGRDWNKIIKMFDFSVEKGFNTDVIKEED